MNNLGCRLPIMHTLRDRLIEARQESQLSQQQLAEKAGISQGYLSEIESGKKSGSLSVLTRIAAALDVELRDIT